jgi:hypothetical protein
MESVTSIMTVRELTDYLRVHPTTCTNMINRQHAAADEIVEIEIRRSAVYGQLVFRLFESDEDARFRVVPGAVVEKFDAEHGLAASRSAADQSRTPARQTAKSNFVETRNAGGRLFETLRP